MAASVTGYALTPPTASRRGLKTPSYTATYYIEVDQTVCGERVIELAADEDIIPDLGDSFEWESDGDDPKYVDDSAFALDFEANLLMRASDDVRAWVISVTWREPDPRKNEVPTSLDKAPLERDPLYWIEYNNHSEYVAIAAPVTNATTGALGSDEIMQNAAGEQFPPITQDILRPVVVIQQNVASPEVALTQNETYENTVNENSFTLFGKTIEKHTARYIRAETSDPVYEAGITYYRMLTRIEISRTPYYTHRFNEGSYYLDGGSGGARKTIKDGDGFIVPGPYPLKTNGDLAASTSDFNDRLYLTLFTAPFGSFFS